MTKSYASDEGQKKFEEIWLLLQNVHRRTKPTTVDLYEVFCAVLYLLRTVHSYFAKWSEPDQDGVSVLERALEKSGWRGSFETGAQRLSNPLDRGRAKCEEHGHGSAQGVLSQARRSRGSSATSWWIRKVLRMRLR